MARTLQRRLIDDFDWPLFLVVSALAEFIAEADAMRTGMRVTARWRAERTGSILDLACFVPVAPEAP